MKIRSTITVGTLKVEGWSWQACASLYHQRSQCGGWSYKLARVCRRWRYFILTSAPFLDLSLLCMCGTHCRHACPFTSIPTRYRSPGQRSQHDVSRCERWRRHSPLYSDSVIGASTASAFSCLFQVHKSSSCLWARNL